MSSDSPASRPFETAIKVRFSDVDPAGIAYYPRVTNFFHVAMEDFFEEALGTKYSVVLGRDGIGFPAVKLETEFVRPLRFGEVIAVTVTVADIGKSSLVFCFGLYGPDGTHRAEATVKVVCVNMKTLKPVPIPDRYRAALGEHRSHGAA